MKLVPQSPKIALKAFIKQKPLRSEIDVFKANLITLLDKISVIERRPKDETEEHLKNDLRDFLRDTYYRDKNAINTKDKKDLVVHCTEKTTSDVAVIIEAKRPTNIGEMITAGNPNKKALHELILYYLDERHAHKNNQLKHLVITNIHQWYIIDANHFDKHIERNSQIKKLYETKVNDKKDNPFFYEEIAKICDKIDLEIPCVYFDIRSYDTILRNSQKDDDRELTALYKILSPQHLLKIATPNDSNSLNEKFYKELLHIIGLEEAKEAGKNIIRRKLDKRNHASLIEATIEAIHTEDVLHRIPDISIYGDTKDERIFAIALELTITWINRCLFLKLLEGQLVAYHKDAAKNQTPLGRGRGGLESGRGGLEDFHFLNTSTIHDFDELFKLFHKVLAVHTSGRSAAITVKYHNIPYLNSSLFEISELEDHTVKINSLDNSGKLELMKGSILTSPTAKPLHLERTQNGESVMPPLQYLFEFLDAYDFASDGTDDIQDDNKTIINASVLGKVFEKINGYKDGSIFTPGFITMYMCRKAIRLAVVQKFKDTYGWNIDTFDDIKNYMLDRRSAKDILEFNAVINSLRLCDPAVGSGHYLVSALNEFIVIKYELGIFADENGSRIRDYSIEIVNDELLVTDFEGNIFEYKMRDGKPLNNKVQQLQKTLFHEKQTIIENCLFGVDINPNSVKICRLRLWIELLKSAYYKESSGGDFELETLPNIDINIKCGNSLLSRFALDSELGKELKRIGFGVKEYRVAVDSYKNSKSRDEKRGLQILMNDIKNNFRTEIGNKDPKVQRLGKLGGELFTLLNQTSAFELTDKQKKAEKDKQLKLQAEITKLTHEIEDIKSNAIYKNAFEWRFEFPEVLNNNGDFEGFDVVVGNPPYGVAFSKAETDYFRSKYNTAVYRVESYVLFIEFALPLLKLKGLLNYIIPNTILNLAFTQPARELLLAGSKLLEIVGLPTNVFSEATVDTIILRSEKADNISTYHPIDVKVKTFDKKQIITVLDNPQKEFIVKAKDWFDQRSFNLQAGNFEAALLSKIEHDKRNINDIGELYYGIKAYQVGKGKPPQTPEIRDLKPFTSYNRMGENWLPFFDGKHVGRYMVYWEENNWLNYGEWLAEPRRPSVFEGEKILIRKITSKTLIATYIPETSYCNTLLFVLKLKGDSFTYKYVLSVLNSVLIGWYFRNKFQINDDDTFPQIMIRDILQFPIPDIPESAQQPFITLVDQILAAKQAGEDTGALERRIDELVYELYGLTEEEIAVVEG